MQIKARDVMIALRQPDEMSALNVIPAVVAEIGPLDGPSVEIKLDCSGEALVARLTRYSVERLSLRTGTPVFAIVKSVSFDRSALGTGWHDIPAADAEAAQQ
jgi:molybdate transport system ATP-binding protein